MEELDRMLLADVSARSYYLCHAAVEVTLRSIGEADKIIPFTPVRNHWKWPTLAAAAAIVLVGTIWRPFRHGASQPVVEVKSTTSPVVEVKSAASPVVAVISQAETLRWNIGQTPASGQLLRPGIVQVSTGSLSLAMSAGQAVRVQGPAEFELLESGEFSLRMGAAAFFSPGSPVPFIVHLPKGAVVDRGSDYSVNVEPDGTAEVRVFENQVVVSTVGTSERTLEERALGPGNSMRVSSVLSPGAKPADQFLRVHPVSITPLPVHLGDASYASRVLASAPVAYWRFETIDSQREVPDEAGSHPLKLMGKSKLEGADSRRFMITNDREFSGFATTRETIPGLDTSDGSTVECLLFSSAESYGTAIAFEVPGVKRSPATPSFIQHDSQIFLIERMGRRGEHIGHLHPDFSLRCLFRSPPAHLGGINLYSRESHLLHRWVHVAAVRDGTQIRLYVDGQLSASTEVSLPFGDFALRPVVGRLQPLAEGDHRQWCGGIDEVAIYDRPLSADEIRAHVLIVKP